ncbi:MAG: VWA domain-containing protein [Parachlamydiaceae bacterium]|nr:VWA domain-containing protein [Parachlamydiaceae bacterium]
MESISFAIDWRALPIAILIGFICYVLWKLKKRFQSPQVFVSDLSSFKISKSWRTRLANMPTLFKYLSLGALLLAFIDPRIYIEQKENQQNQDNQSSQGIALYLVLDQSGSMRQTINVPSSSGLPSRITKIDLLKELTKQFIIGDPKLGLTGRPNDLIGLVEFARTARLMVPLTLDHRLVVEKLASFNVVKDKAEDGTAIGYAIYKTTNLIASTRNFAKDLIGKGKPAYEIKSSVIVLVTDGMQDPNPADIGSRWRWIDPLEAAKFAKSNNVKLYIINLEPAFNSAEFSANRSQMQKTAEITGGKFFLLSNQSSLSDIYAEIDQLEKSSLPAEEELLKNLRKNLSRDELPNIFSRKSFYPYLVAIGLICLALWAAMETVLLRRFP